MCSEENRRTGKTTRQVDELVQKLFNEPTKWHLVEDESFKCSDVDGVPNYHINQALLDRINRRVMSEHHFQPHNKYEKNKRYISLNA